MLFIFDLDQTLVDTKIALPLRDQKRWGDVYTIIPQMKIYPNIKETLEYLKSKGHTISVVTTSPRIYAQKVIANFNLEITNIVAYHDVSRRKPDPESIYKAMSNAGVSAKDCISFGDRKIDIEASNRAGVSSCACFWDTVEAVELQRSNPTHSFQTTTEMFNFIKHNF